MSDNPDPGFANRTQAHIDQANGYLANAHPARVSASLSEASARFHAWLWANNAPSGPELLAKRDQAIAYFLEQNRKAFEEHFDDYVKNHAQYISGPLSTRTTGSTN